MRLVSRAVLLLACSASLLSGLVGSATATPRDEVGRHHRHVVEVTGAVAHPYAYSRAELAALPQTTLTDERPHTGHHELTGVLLQTLVDEAGPQLPDAKNAALRVVATVDGGDRRHGQPKMAAVAHGETDPAFGNHPALLVLARDGRVLRGGPELVFPTDSDRARTVRDVRRVAVAVDTTPIAETAAGSLVVRTSRRDVVLTAERLAALPQQTRTVTFQAGTASQTHDETGPTLAGVLRAARVRTTEATAVTAVGTDGYRAAVTPGEATSGGRPLLISLVEDGTALTRPRLVVDGDLRGGRYVSDVTTLVVGASRR